MTISDLLSLNSHQTFETPEWPGAGPFTVRRITAGERITLIETARALTDSTKPLPMLASYAALFLGDENGKRIITDSESEQALQLPCALVERLVDRGLELNGLRAGGSPKKN